MTNSSNDKEIKNILNMTTYRRAVGLQNFIQVRFTEVFMDKDRSLSKEEDMRFALWILAHDYTEDDTKSRTHQFTTEQLAELAHDELLSLGFGKRKDDNFYLIPVWMFFALVPGTTVIDHETEEEYVIKEQPDLTEQLKVGDDTMTQYGFYV